ncbi:MAG: hypothetical protein ACFCBW_23380, partial [Candidatus Competibacterales bacterium]
MVKGSQFAGSKAVGVWGRWGLGAVCGLLWGGWLGVGQAVEPVDGVVPTAQASPAPAPLPQAVAQWATVGEALVVVLPTLAP